MSANAGAVLIRRQHVVGADRDQAAVTDLHLTILVDQPLGLAQILGTVRSPAENHNHRVEKFLFLRR